jgi:hypothetical protein
MSLAYLGLWPWLEIPKARGHGLSHGFGQNFDEAEHYNL